MNLRELHTPVPLREADYAAVRARVLAEMDAGRRRRRWIVAVAAAAILAIVVALREPQTARRTCNPCSAGNPAGVPRPVIAQTAGRIAGATHAVATQSAGRIAGATQKPSPLRPQPLRIELHTDDPDVRIIWIVNPKTREES